MFYYNQNMTWIKHLWRRLNSAWHTQLIILTLDPLHTLYLKQVASKANISLNQVAQGLLKDALVNSQVSEVHLERWRELTPRQQQIAALTCLNFTNRQIAARLGISPDTVKAHLRNLLHRFDLHSKAELRQALENWDFSTWI